jgi:hypothetical protein
VPITWVADIDQAATTGDLLAQADPTARMAFSLDEGLLASRQSLRRRLADARRRLPDVDALVVRGCPSVEHRDLLVQEGIRILCVDRFEQVTRGSRRPAPRGWQCRSVVWGLWEVMSSPQPTVGVLGGIIPWASSGILAPGSLSVVDATDAGNWRLDRLISLVTKKRSRAEVQVATLSELPELLVAGGQRRSGSVLKAA